MKTRFLFIFTILVLIILGVFVLKHNLSSKRQNQNTSISLAPVQYSLQEQYVNKDIGIAINYPKGWSINEASNYANLINSVEIGGNGGRIYFLTHPNGGGFDPNDPTITKKVIHVGGKSINFYYLPRGDMNGYKKWFSEYNNSTIIEMAYEVSNSNPQIENVILNMLASVKFSPSK